MDKYLFKFDLSFDHNGETHIVRYIKFCSRYKQTRLYKNLCEVLNDPNNTAKKLEVYI